MTEEIPTRTKMCYIGAPAIFKLELLCQSLYKAFSTHCYLVGSATQRPDFRDVDIRMIMADEKFDELFPNAENHWEQDPRWCLMTISISEYLSKEIGMLVDFQFQRRSNANKDHGGKERQALGLVFANKGDTDG
jgi:hypothetical protein